MTDIIQVLKRLVPDQIDIFVRRYSVLNAVKTLQPIGRRGVANHLELTERIVRTEIDKLNEEGLVTVNKLGVSLSEEGKEILEILKDVVHEILGISILEKQLEKILNIKKVFIVKGDCSFNENVKKDIGNVAAQVILKNINIESTISLTGGSTIACVVDSISNQSNRQARLVVPARGSVGHHVEQQSDTLVSKLAKKLNAEYRLLNIPDSMSLKAMNEIKNEPMVQVALKEMQNADVLAFGIGNALKMAKKRQVSDAIYDFLVRKEAIAEAFGYYFNKDGEIVYSSHSISINLDDIKKIPFIIAVAGGNYKALSIIAVSKILKNATMVIDEGAAIEILKLYSEKI